MATSDVESTPLNAPLNGEAEESPQQQRPVARLAVAGACVLAATAMVSLVVSRHFATPSKSGTIHGVSLADAAETQNHVLKILDNIYKERNESVKSIKDALAKENWTDTAKYAHQYDRLTEHAESVQQWNEEVMKVYNALGDGAYEQSDILLGQAVKIQCYANNKARAIDLEHKLSEEVDFGGAEGVEKADLLILLLEKMGDECGTATDGEEAPPVDESGFIPGGTLTFESAGTAADVEQAVSVVLAKHLGLQSSQVIASATEEERRLRQPSSRVTATAFEARRLAEGSDDAPKSWQVGFKVASPDAVASPDQAAAETAPFTEEMKAKLTALGDEQDALVDQLCFVLPGAKPDSFKVALPAPGPLTGRILFTCAGSKADVEQGVSQIIVELLEVEPDALTLEVMGARRLANKPKPAPAPTEAPEEPKPTPTEEPEAAETTEGPEEPTYQPLPWVVTWTVTLPDLDAYKKVKETIGGVVEDSSDLIKKLVKALPELEPETLQAELADETGAFAVTVPAQSGNCSGVTDSCLESKCCVNEGHFCYKKDEWWAGCRPDCNIGIHVHDPPDHKTPWTCEVIDSNPAAPPPIPEGAAPAPGPPAECAGQYQDCSKAKCCGRVGEFCYKKDDHWAQCMPTCTKGISPWDKEPHNTPWSCEPIDINEGQPAPFEEDGSVGTTTEAVDAVATTS